MKNAFIFFAVFIVATTFGFNRSGKKVAVAQVTITHNDTQYVCLPCGSDCDKAVYKKPGICPHCMMQLVDRTTVVFNSIEPDALCNFIKDMGRNNIVLLDVRTPEEFNGTAKDKFGKLAGAINIPVQQLEKRMAELNKYKNKEIIVYCSHSHRSPMASYMLTQNGFKKITNMELGMSEWTNKVEQDECSKKLYIKQ